MLATYVRVEGWALAWKGLVRVGHRIGLRDVTIAFFKALFKARGLCWWPTLLNTKWEGKRKLAISVLLLWLTYPAPHLNPVPTGPQIT